MCLHELSHKKKYLKAAFAVREHAKAASLCIVLPSGRFKGGADFYDVAVRVIDAEQLLPWYLNNAVYHLDSGLNKLLIFRFQVAGLKIEYDISMSLVSGYNQPADEFRRLKGIGFMDGKPFFEHNHIAPVMQDFQTHQLCIKSLGRFQIVHEYDGIDMLHLFFMSFVHALLQLWVMEGYMSRLSKNKKTFHSGKKNTNLCPG
jgi:hypothetical protein